MGVKPPFIRSTILSTRKREQVMIEHNKRQLETLQNPGVVMLEDLTFDFLVAPRGAIGQVVAQEGNNVRVKFITLDHTFLVSLSKVVVIPYEALDLEDLEVEAENMREVSDWYKNESTAYAGMAQSLLNRRQKPDQEVNGYIIRFNPRDTTYAVYSSIDAPPVLFGVTKEEATNWATMS